MQNVQDQLSLYDIADAAGASLFRAACAMIAVNATDSKADIMNGCAMTGTQSLWLVNHEALMSVCTV